MRNRAAASGILLKSAMERRNDDDPASYLSGYN